MVIQEIELVLRSGKIQFKATDIYLVVIKMQDMLIYGDIHSQGILGLG
jgi:hypothetical protein